MLYVNGHVWAVTALERRKVEYRLLHVLGQLQPADFTALLQKRDQLKRAWLHPETLCLDCRSGKLFGDGHDAQLWDMHMVDADATLLPTPSSGQCDGLFTRAQVCTMNSEPTHMYAVITYV